MERKHSLMSTSFIMCGSFYIIHGAFSNNSSAFVVICGTRVIICTLVIICDIFVIICSAYVVVCVGVSLHEVISGSYAVLCFSPLNTVCVLYYDVKRSRDLCKSF